MTVPNIKSHLERMSINNLAPNSLLDGHMPCYNTDSFRISHIENTRTPSKFSSKTLIFRPCVLMVTRNEDAQIRQHAAYHA